MVRKEQRKMRVVESCTYQRFMRDFNVLTEQMSLVDNRVPSLYEREKSEFNHRARLSYKTGKD